MTAPAPHAFISDEQLERVLGQATTRFVRLIAQQAQALGADIYLVGGAVRDVLLNRPTFDLDFALEGEVSPLVNSLQVQMGGRVNHHAPFGTAKWDLDERVGAFLGMALDERLDHLDFAAARYETYLHPTALPTVYPGTISQDLLRRDFTINTLALHLHPDHAHHAILDMCGGLADLNAGQIRVLHDQSFLDDPTRIIRAMRFSQRFGFAIDTHTVTLLLHALPMLRRITGERLRNDLNLLLREEQPEQAFARLDALGVLSAIHPAFTFNAQHANLFIQARTTSAAWFTNPPPALEALYWHMLTAHMAADDLRSFAERLLFPHHLADSLLAGRDLLADVTTQNGLDTPSAAYHRLKPVPEAALWSVWLISRAGVIQRYCTTWQHIHISTNGRALQARGLKPSPLYGWLLRRLLDARLDGEVQDDAAENALLDQLLASPPQL